MSGQTSGQDRARAPQSHGAAEMSAAGKQSLPVNARENSGSPPPGAKSPFSTIIRLAVGLLLLISAGFKVHAIFTEPYFADSILGSPLWMVGLVECEILLGLWLISGVALRIAWHVALAAFVGFAGVNVYLLATGATTCGCFGTVETHPWVMLGLDLAVLVALFIWRPKWRASETPTANASGVFKHIAIVGGLSAVMLGIGAAWLVVSYGSLQAGIMFMRGEVISIDPADLDVGENAYGSRIAVNVNITNHGSQAVRIIGGTTSCKCVVTEDLPVLIPAGTSKEINIGVRFTGKVGEFRQQFRLWTNSPSHHDVLGRLHGVILPDESAQ